MSQPDDPSSTLTADAWIGTFADALGVDAPSPEEVEQLLDLAGVAAHASERVAAPIACFLVGRAGVALDAAMQAAREVHER